MKKTRTAGHDRLNVIAEIGTSHNGSLERARRLISAAAEAGADCIKTQIVFADEIIHPETGEVALPGGNIRLYDRFRELEQDFGFYSRLKELTEEAGLEFLASPFGLRSLEWLLKLGCRSIKIASPELNHFPLLRAAAESGKKMILSTGVSELSDIKAALDIIGRTSASSRREAVLLHCITSYPAPEDEYNLNVISTLRSTFDVECGVSDHSINPFLVPSIAAALGAGYIEKHITLSNEDGGLDDPIALPPPGFAEMVKLVRETEKSAAALDMLRGRFGNDTVEKVLGDGIKRPAPSEEKAYGRTNRSVHALTALPEGSLISSANTALLRTEKKLRPGVRPEFYDRILGQPLLHAVDSGEGIRAADLGLEGEIIDFPS